VTAAEVCRRCGQPLAEHRTMAPFAFCADGFLNTSKDEYPARDATDDGCSHGQERRRLSANRAYWRKQLDEYRPTERRTA
jgi:hypothetical protein